jgi:hypothetical protein
MESNNPYHLLDQRYGIWKNDGSRRLAVDVGPSFSELLKTRAHLVSQYLNALAEMAAELLKHFMCEFGSHIL